MHQCALFFEYPIKPHSEFDKRIGGSLKGNYKMGIYIRPRDSYVKVWPDANFSVNWFPEEVEYDSDTERSRSVFFVSYLGCTVMWKSKL